MSGDAPRSYADIGQLGKKPFTDDERARRRRFARLWEPTIAALRERGWEDIHPGVIIQLYILDGESERLDWVLASPDQEELYVRLNFTSPLILREVEPKFAGFQVAPHGRVPVTREKAKRAAGVEEFLEARITMRRLFAGCTTSEEMAMRLHDFVIPLVDLAS